MPNIPSPNDDEDDAPLTQEEMEAIYDQLPPFDEMTPQDACIAAGFLLDMDMPVPVNLVTKAHSAGLYIAH
jgi:hypothetical protein